MPVQTKDVGSRVSLLDRHPWRFTGVVGIVGSSEVHGSYRDESNWCFTSGDYPISNTLQSDMSGWELLTLALSSAE